MNHMAEHRVSRICLCGDWKMLSRQSAIGASVLPRRRSHMSSFFQRDFETAHSKIIYMTPCFRRFVADRSQTWGSDPSCS
ncbi:hypothetical protein Scep_017484 [Stephania cephalantha]|uniref:Uncharacterized protein n=1 Tax=Stephania cephalantha TaxID=152367 RepID=A0AAP0IPM1_9MAGN